MWLSFLFYIKIVMRTTKKFYRIRINLTHRLARKIVNYIDALPEDKLKCDSRLRHLRRYLSHMWKWNYRRFQKWAMHWCSNIQKKIWNRQLYIWTKWNLHINDYAPSNNYADSMLIDIDDLIKYICDKNCLPF